MPTMSDEAVFPVRIRVGDTEEAQIGTVTLDLAAEGPEALPRELANFLRAVANYLDEMPTPERDPE